MYLPYQNVHAPNQAPPDWELNNYSYFGAGNTYANMLHMLDSGCANVTAALRKRSFWGNSLLLFTADNVRTRSPSAIVCPFHIYSGFLPHARVDLGAGWHWWRWQQPSTARAQARPVSAHPPTLNLSLVLSYGPRAVCFHIIRNLETMHD